jgi:predicted transcriptional regulator
VTNKKLDENSLTSPISYEILVLLNQKNYSILELSRAINIAHKNLLPHLELLEKNKWIEIMRFGRGKKSIIKLTKELAVTDTYLNFRRVVEKTKAVWDLMDKSQKIKFYDELIERYALLKRSGMSFERLREIKEKRSNP